VAFPQEKALWKPFDGALGTRAAIDRCLEGLSYGAKEPTHAFAPQSICRGARVNASLEQDLIGVDVADTCYQSLIHEYRFDVAASSGENPSQSTLVKMWIERIGAEAPIGNKRVHALREAHSTEAPRVHVGKTVPRLEDENEPRVRWVCCGFVNNLWEAIRPEVHRQDASAAQLKEQLLAMAMRRFYPIALKPALQLFRQDPIQNAGVADGGVIDRSAATSVGDHALERLYVRQFRHQCIPGSFDDRTSRMAVASRILC